MNLAQKQSNAFHFLTDQQTTEILYGGGAGGGKSMLGCFWHIYQRTKFPETRGLIGRKELKAIKESTLITYLKVAKMLGYRAGIDFKFNQQDMVITWRNGSRTIFKEMKLEPSDPNYESLGSTEFTDVFIDEAGECPEKGIEIANSRIRWMLTDYCPCGTLKGETKEYKKQGHGERSFWVCGNCAKETSGLAPKLLLTCNPNINWIKHRYIKTRGGEYIKLQSYQKYIRATVDDNMDESFKAVYKEALNKLNPYDRARLLFGDWDAIPKTGGEFYKCFDAKRHVGDYKYRPDLPLHISFDENVNPYFPAGIFQVEIFYDEKKRPIRKEMRMIAEIYGRHPNNTVKWVCAEIKRKYQGHQSGMFIYGDATSQKEDVKQEKGHDLFQLIIQALSDFKPQRRVSSSNPSIVMRGQFFNSVLEHNEGDIWFMIDRSCNEAIMDFEQTKEASDGKKDKKVEKDPQTLVSFQKHGHYTDLSDYALCFIWSDEYAQYQRGGKPFDGATFGGGSSAEWTGANTGKW